MCWDMWPPEKAWDQEGLMEVVLIVLDTVSQICYVSLDLCLAPWASHLSFRGVTSATKVPLRCNIVSPPSRPSVPVGRHLCRVCPFWGATWLGFKSEALRSSH